LNLRLIAASAFVALVSGTQAASADQMQTRVTKDKLASQVVYEFSRQVGPGRVVKHSTGADGFVKKTYLVKLHNGKPVEKKLVNVETRKPVDTVFFMGRAGFTPSRSSFKRGIVRTMIATGYDPSPATIGRGATGYTCTGRHAEFGCIAVDPRVIPFGTLMYVEGYGFGLACDRGSAIKGNRIDLCFNQKHMADSFGKKPVKVHILLNR
jgi:3D (Asp-Asp-Asp) domain-containing protein